MEISAISVRLLCLHQRCDVIKEFSDVRADHGVRDLGDDQMLSDRPSAFSTSTLSADTDLSGSRLIDLQKLVLIDHDSSCGKIRALEYTASAPPW